LLAQQLQRQARRCRPLAPRPQPPPTWSRRLPPPRTTRR
jgi:hypothetical protein